MASDSVPQPDAARESDATSGWCAAGASRWTCRLIGAGPPSPAEHLEHADRILQGPTQALSRKRHFSIREARRRRRAGLSRRQAGASYAAELDQRASAFREGEGARQSARLFGEPRLVSQAGRRRNPGARILLSDRSRRRTYRLRARQPVSECHLLSRQRPPGAGGLRACHDQLRGIVLRSRRCATKARGPPAILRHAPWPPNPTLGP